MPEAAPAGTLRANPADRIRTLAAVARLMDDDMMFLSRVPEPGEAQLAPKRVQSPCFTTVDRSHHRQVSRLTGRNPRLRLRASAGL